MMKKHILFLSAYFRPEKTADTHLDEDLIFLLTKKGYKITVLCPVPTRGLQKGQAEEYKKKKREYLYDGSVTIIRFWAPQEKTNVLLRAIRYFYCNIRQYCIASRMKDIDLIYCISTPPTQGALSAFVKKRISRKYHKTVENVYYLEDIFPDTLVAAGLTTKDSILWKIGRKIEDYTYRENTKIITISEGCVQNIKEKGVNDDKIEVIYNWVDLQNINYVTREKNYLFDEYHLDRDLFYIVYAGNLGKSQNVDLILDAAKVFITEEKMMFLIIGSGGEEKRIKERTIKERISNVAFIPLQSLDKVSEVYSLGDVDIVTCKKGFGLSALPSKTWSIMAVKRPIIASFDIDGDLCRLIMKTKSGLCADADDVSQFVNVIRQVYSMKEQERALMGEHGREYVMRYREALACTSKFEDIISQLVN